MAQSILNIEVHVDGIAPLDLARRVAVPTSKPHEMLAALQRFVSGLPPKNAEVTLRVDSATGAAATLTSNVTGASVIAGETITLAEPSGRTWTVTGVASGSVAGDGTFVVSGTSNTAATNIRAAFNTLPGFSGVGVLSGATNALIFTAATPGTWGNGLRVVDGTGGGISATGALAGGVDPTARVTSSIALVHANITAADTTTIGAVTLAWAASAVGEDQVTIGANVTADGDNLAAKINAHSKLAGLVSAVNNAGTVTITYLVDPRAALHFRLAVSDATSATLVQPATTMTLASVQAARTYALGAAT